MDDLSVHYARLLGLGDDWEVADVNLDGSSGCCPVCEEQRPIKDHAAEREWRHLDTMQFETVLVDHTPRGSRFSLPWHAIRLPNGLHFLMALSTTRVRFSAGLGRERVSHKKWIDCGDVGRITPEACAQRWFAVL